MASHRMSDQDRPRRAVPAWVTAPPERADDDGLEARPAAVTSAPAPEAAAPVSALPEQPAPTLLADEIIVPDYPPEEHLLPPAPTSPAVHTLPFDAAAVPAAAPVSPVDLAPPAPAPAPTTAPGVGQPRFSVPGLEHVVVEGSEPEPVGPIGYRTPARFAHQQSVRPAAEVEPARSFDAVIAPPTTPAVGSAPASSPSGAPVAAPAAHAAVAPTTPDAAEDTTDDVPEAARAPRPTRIGPTAAGVLGAVAGLATLGLAAWWFTAPATVHGVGLVLGVLALVLSVTTLRSPAATWQRPVALLGAVLGGVGTLVLLWAVAAALLPLAGVTLPDLTGSGVTPTLAP